MPAAASARPIDRPPAAHASRLLACTIVGTQGNDVLIGTPGPDVICARGGDDVVRGEGGDDVIYGGPGSDRLDGGAGNDRLFGWRGADRLSGGSGDDFLQGGPDADVLAGGPGTDTVDYSTRRVSLHVTIGHGADDGFPGEGDDVRGDVEIVRAGSGSDVLVGDARANRLFGGAGRDRLNGRGGADTLAGGPGVDTIQCGRGGGVRVLAGAKDHLHGTCGRGRTTEPSAPRTRIQLSNASVDENQPAGTVVGTLSARGFNRPRFALAGGPDDAAFAISGDKLVTRAVFDFEAKSTYTVGVRVTARHRRPYAQLFTIAVGDVNEPPVASAVQVTGVAEGDFRAFALSGSDPDGNPLTFHVGAPAHGHLDTTAPAATCDGARPSHCTATVQYTPDAGFNGVDAFTYTVNDGSVDSAPATVAITVDPVNSAPVATDGNVALAEDQAKAVDLGALVSDRETSDANLTYAIVSGPAHGALTGSGASRTYTPAANYHGADSFTYKVTDRGDPDGCAGAAPACAAPLSSATKTVSLTVNPVNDAPAAPAANISVDEDHALPIDLSTLVSDVETSTANLTFAITGAPAHGTLAGAGAAWTYTPAADYNGPDAIVYTVTDRGDPDNCAAGPGCSAPATTTGTIAIGVNPVNDAPQATDGAASLPEDGSTVVDLGALASDAETSDANLTYTIVNAPAHGALSGGGSAPTYTPDANFNGPDSFTYKVTDRGDPDGCGGGAPACDAPLSSATKTVSLTVNPVNDRPVAGDGSVNAIEDTPSAVDLAALATDVETTVAHLTYSIVSGPAHGTLTGAGASRTYTPNPDFNGPDSFTYTVTDRGDPDNCGAAGPGCTAALTSTTGTVTLAVAAVNDAPVNTVPAGPITAVEATDTPLAGLSVADVDAGGDAVQLTLSASHGTLSVNTSVFGGVSQAVGNGTKTVAVTASLAQIDATLRDANGLVYRGDAGYTGPDTLSVESDDLGHNGAGGPLTDTDSVALQVLPPNHPPVASDQSVSTDEDTAKAITLTATDADGDPLTYAIVSAPAHGSLTGAGAARTYTPDPDYNGSDSFTFTANDGRADSAPATVSITVNPVNDAPRLAGIEAGALAYTENDPATAITASTTVSDVDSANFDTGTLTVDYSAGGTADDRLEIGSIGPIATAGANVTYNGTTIGTFAGGGGTTPLVVTLNANADTAATQALVRAVTYRNVSDDPATAARTARFVLTDGDGGTSAAATRAITVAAVNDAPALAGIESGTLGYVESVDSAPAQSQVTSTLTVADPDNANLAGAVVQITGACKPAEDVLVFADQNGITGTYAAATCKLTLSGSSSLANYQAALRSVKYEDTSDTPDTTTRTVTFTVNDGTLDSTTQSRDVSVTAANDSPVPGADAYSGTNSALAGVTLAVGTTPSTPSVAVSGSLLANDSDPDTPQASLTASAPTTSAHGGAVSVNGDGTFNYTPAPGFTGTDTFTYTVDDHGTPDRTATATVTINVAGPRVWFVDPAAAAGGNGTSAAPLNSLAPLSTGGAADSLDGNGDVIFVYQGTAATTGFVLEDGQRLVGQPQGLSVTNGNGTYDLVAAGGTNPQVRGITLGEGNTIQRVDSVGAVTGSGVNALTYGDNTRILGSGGGLVLTGGSGTISVGAHIATTGGHSVSIANRTGATTTLSGEVDDQGTGISLTGNTGATIAFTGGIVAATGANPSFTATGGGTVTVSGPDATLATSAAAALTVTNTNIGAAGLTFRHVTANGAANGIVLNNTGSAGGLTVTGIGSVAQGGDASGGTIQNMTGAGISLTGTSAVALNDMRIASTAGGAGISGTGVKGFSFTNGTITNSGFDATNTTVCATAPATAHCPFDSNIAFNSNGATVDNVDGAVTITNNVLSQAYQFGVDILNNSGTISSLNISNNAITSPTAPANTAGSGLRVQALGSAGGAASITKGTLNGNDIRNFPNGAGIVVQGGNTSAAGAPAGSFGTGTGANAVQIDNNLIRGASPAAPLSTNCILVTMPGRGSGFMDVSGNGTAATPLGDNRGNCVSLNATGAYHLTVNASNNTVSPGAGQNPGAFGIAGGTDSQVMGDGSTADSAVMNLTAIGNTVSNSTNSGLRFLANASGTLNARIQNNHVGTPNTGASGPSEPGIRVDSGTSAGTAVDTNVCLDIGGNTTSGSTFSGTTFPGIGLRKQGTVAATNDFGIVGLTPTPATAAQTEAYVAGQNPASTAGTFGTGGAGVISGSNFISCTLPF